MPGFVVYKILLPTSRIGSIGAIDLYRDSHHL